MIDPTSRVDKFLAGFSPKPRQRGNLIFALDATASREHTWDSAAAAAGFDVPRGRLDRRRSTCSWSTFAALQGYDAECKASDWVGNPMQLAALMAKIRCETGKTQIGRVLDHALRETTKRPIGALVFVGDAAEEPRDQLVVAARKLAEAGTPVFMFQEGDDQIARLRFSEIAEVSRGAYHKFDAGSARQLGELLRAVAAFAVGGVVALEKQDSAAARLLLRQVGGKG